MRTTLSAAAILALARVVAAQEACISLTTAFPPCALPCVTSAAAEVGCTDPRDVACRCIPTNSASIQERAIECVVGNCLTIPGALDSAISAGTIVCGCVATAVPDPPTVTATATATDTATVTEPPISDPDPTDPTATCDSESPCQASADAVPDCAEDCIFSAAETDAGCNREDFECQCSSASVIQSAAQGCVIDECGAATGIQVLSSVSALCDCVTASPTVPCDTTATATDTGSDTATETDTETETETDEPTSEPTDEPTTTEGGTTCEAATITDCGPVASSEVPECAQACFSSAAPGVGCDVDDYACQCEDEARSSLTQLLVPCVATACDAAALPSVIAGADAVCSCAAAPPSGGDCSTTDGGGGGGGTTSKPTSKPTKTKTDDEPSTTCESATTSDCSAVAITAVPECAQACFSSAAPGVGCEVNEFGCLCEPDAQASLTQLLVPCVASRCDAAALPSVIAGASEVCACASAPPFGGDCGGGGGGGGGTKPPPGPTSDYGGGGGGGGGGGSSCAPATTSDCGPVATSAVPECAQPCFTSAAPQVDCDADDYACQCVPEARESLSQLLIPCVASRCDAAALPSVIAGADSVCACATAAPVGGGDDCNGGGGGGPSPPEPTGGDGGDGGDGGGDAGNTCAPATSADCGPVATSVVPECAQPCFTSAAPQVDCDADDYACQCVPEARESLSQLLIPCVASRCDAAALPSVIAGADSVCACATAAPVGGGDCPGGGGGGSTPPKPTGGAGGGGGSGGEASTCKAAGITAADCGPVASSAIPECAQECFTVAAPDVGCDVTDYACQCQDEAQASLSQLLVPCVASNCEAAQLTAVIAGASSVCECALSEPTGGADDCDSGSGGGGGGGDGDGSGGGDNGGSDGGSDDGSDDGSGGGGAGPTQTGPAEVVPGSGARAEISIVAAVFGSFWLIAVML